MDIRACCQSIFSLIVIELNVPHDDFSSIVIELNVPHDDFSSIVIELNVPHDDFSSIVIELNVPHDDFSSIMIKPVTKLTFVNLGHSFKKAGSVLLDISDAWDKDFLNSITSD